MKLFGLGTILRNSAHVPLAVNPHKVRPLIVHVKASCAQICTLWSGKVCERVCATCGGGLSLTLIRTVMVRLLISAGLDEIAG